MCYKNVSFFFKMFVAMDYGLRYAWNEVDCLLLAFVYKFSINLCCLYVSMSKQFGNSIQIDS